MKFCGCMIHEAMSIPANSARHVAGWLACAVTAPGSAGVRRLAGAHKQGRGRRSEGARARVDRAAQVAISGGRARSGPAGSGRSTGVSKLCKVD